MTSRVAAYAQSLIGFGQAAAFATASAAPLSAQPLGVVSAQQSILQAALLAEASAVAGQLATPPASRRLERPSSCRACG